MTEEKKYHSLREVESVTQEVLDMVETITDGWFSDVRIDWEEVWDRLEGYELEDGSYPEIPDMDNPAIRKIKKYIRDLRKLG